MVTYLTTQEATIQAAEKARKENHGTYIEQRSCRCDCGQSLACYLIDGKTLNMLEIFVNCEACHNQY